MIIFFKFNYVLNCRGYKNAVRKACQNSAKMCSQDGIERRQDGKQNPGN